MLFISNKHLINLTDMDLAIETGYRMSSWTTLKWHMDEDIILDQLYGIKDLKFEE